MKSSRIKNLKEKLDAMKPKRNPSGCYCVPGETWCDKCITLPVLQKQRMPDGTYSYGYVITNLPKQGA